MERLDVRRYPEEDRTAECLLDHCNALFFGGDSATKVVICYVDEEKSLVVLRPGASVPPHYHANIGGSDNGSERWAWSEHSTGQLFFAVAASLYRDHLSTQWQAVQALEPGERCDDIPGSVPHTVFSPLGGALWVWSPLSHMTGDNSIPIAEPCEEIDMLVKHMSPK